MQTSLGFEKILYIKNKTGGLDSAFELRPELHNKRPAWDMIGSIHHTLCWTQYTNEEFGFWSIANLWTKDENGQATGIVFETPEKPVGDGPAWLPRTATKSLRPPLGFWTRGRPWSGDRTSGGRQMELFN